MSSESDDHAAGSLAGRPVLPASREVPNAGASPEQAVDVRGGLMVFSHDGELLGHVEEFIIDAAGNLTSFVIRSGATVQQDVRILMGWIQSVTRESILLRMTAAELLAASGAIKRAHR